MSIRSAARRVPALVSYLEATGRDQVLGVWRFAGTRLAAVLGATVVTGVLGNLVASGPVSWVASNVVLLGGAAWAWFSASKMAAERDPALSRGRAAAARLAKLGHAGRLVTEVDSRALLALEACAHHWHRIQTALGGPTWERDVPGHWEMVRNQGRRAAELGMAEALLLSEACIGKPSRTREKDVADTFHDLFSLEIASALHGLRDLTRSDWTKYSFRSPNAPTVVPRLLELASELGRLAGEVESANAGLAVHRDALGRESSRAIDMAISELKMIQTAESEIDRLDQR